MKSYYQIFCFNIILFFYQFEFIKIESDSILISFYRIVILPLLLLLLIFGNYKLMKEDVYKYYIVFIFFLSWIISVLGYNYFSIITTIIGNFIQLIVAYFYFRKYSFTKSSLFVLSTWGIIQSFYFISDFSSGNLGLAHRFVGFHWDPNYLCMSVLVSFWAKIYLVKMISSKAIKISLLSFAFLDVLMILFSLSRGGLLALLITTIIYVYFTYRKLFFIVFFGSFSLISYMIGRAQYVTWSDSLSLMDLIIYRTFVKAEEGDISAGRLTFIERYIDMVNRGDGIIHGMPLGYYIDNVNFGTFPHNSIIEILVQGGLLIGAIFYLFFLFEIIRIFLYVIKFKTLPFDLLFLISGLSVLMFLSFGLKISWLFVGLVLAISNKKIFYKKLNNIKKNYVNEF